MARAPRTIRPQTGDEIDESPIDEAVRADLKETASDLLELFDELRGYDQGEIKGVLYRIPRGGGKFEWIEELYPPFNLGEINEGLKERFGGGDFQLRVFVKGRIKKNVNFSIAAEKNPIITDTKSSSDSMALMQMMMAQQAEAAREGRASSDRQMQMMMAMNQAAATAAANQTQMMVGMISAMMGSQTKAVDLIPLMAAMKPENGGMKEAVETMVAMKGLLGDGGGNGGFDPEDIAGSLLKIAGPVAGAIGGLVSKRGQPQPEQVYTVPEGQPQPEGLMLPGISPNPTPTPQMVAEGPRPTHRIIELVRQDIAFMCARGYDPELAADAVIDQLNRAGITENEVNDLMAELAVSGDPWGALAAYGLDLRAYVPWAEQFLQSLMAAAAENSDHAGSDDPAGGGGGEGNLILDGEAGAGWIENA